jgi:RHS repeat-associated protein
MFGRAHHAERDGYSVLIIRRNYRMNLLSRSLARFFASARSNSHPDVRRHESARSAGHATKARRGGRRRSGTTLLERLEDRCLLSIGAELNGGLIPTFTGDAAADSLVIRLGATGNIEYSSNGGGFTADLDSDAGTQSLSIAAALRIDVSLGTGNDTLTLDFSSGTPIPTGGVTYAGGAGSDLIIVAADASFTLSNTTLIVVGRGSVALAGVDQARLSGGAGANLLDASAFTSGSVTLDGAAGDDTLSGGSANDSLNGGPGVDRVFQAASRSQTVSNSMLIGAGTDALTGIEEASLQGGPGNDILDATTFAGPVTLEGGAGDDSLFGGSSGDWLSGGPGDDTIDGGAGDDIAVATADADFTATTSLIRGNGVDSIHAIERVRLTGGPSNNAFTLTDWVGHATVDGGGGSDRLVVSGNWNYSLSATALDLSSGQSFALANVEEAMLTGGSGNNTMSAAGFAGRVTLDGGAGNDSIVGSNQNDELTGGAGNDTIDGGAGTDSLAESADSNLVLSNVSLSGAGSDTLFGVEQARLTGGPSDNRLDAASFSGPVTLNGGAGNDTLVAGSYGSVLSGGSGTNVLTGGSGSDTVAEAGDVHFTLSNNNCTGPGIDTLSSIEQARITGSVNDNTFTVSGWTGTATIEGGLGEDSIVSANDSSFTLTNSQLTRSTGGIFSFSGIESAQLTGGASGNSLNAAAFTLGPVTLDGAGGDDTLQGGTRSDWLIGGSGVDRVIAAGDVSFTLSNTNLNGLGSDLLSSIELAVVSGGPGANIFAVDGWSGQATLDGGAGTDRITSSGNSSYVLSNGSLTQSNGGNFSLTGFEQAALVGDNGPNSINAAGFSGSTTITGAGGNDTLFGGSGTDTLLEQADVSLTLSNTALTGGLGTDSISGFERAVLTGGPSNNTLDARNYSGSVTLDGGNGSDILMSGPGADQLTGGSDASNDTINGGAGTDTLVESGDVSYNLSASAIAGLGNDSLIGIEQARLTGGDSANVFTVTGWTGPATLDGGGGGDRLVAVNDASFVLTDAQLMRSTASAVSLVRFTQATLTGGPGANSIDASGFSGAVTLDGAAGSDTLLGGAGSDQLTGGPGTTNDVVNGGAGTDTLVETGNVNFTLTNTALTGLGSDTLVSVERASLTGGSNNNTLNASGFTLGPVTLDGGAAGDTLIGGPWSDILTGGPGSDNISGGAGTDTVMDTTDSSFTLTDTSLSGNGTDTLNGIELASLSGDASSNSFTVSGWTGRATIDGGSGIDRIIALNDAQFRLTATELQRSVAGSIALVGIEEASLTGGASANMLDASHFTGSTTLDGGSGNDTLLGGFGNDLLNGGVGTDRGVERGDVDFTIGASDVGGMGTDSLNGIEEIEVTGGASNNTFTVAGFAGMATLNGGDGFDLIAASDNANFTLTDAFLARSFGGTFVLANFESGQLIGGSGANTLNASGFSGPVTLDGGTGNDSLIGGSGDDCLTGGPGGLSNDTINGGPGVDTLVEYGDTQLTLTNTSLAGLGTDSLAAIEQAVLTGGSSNRAINASGFTLGSVTLDGGGGADTLTGGTGDDVLTGNAGNDAINGGPGIDTVVESGDVSYVLSNSSLTGMGSDSLSGVEQARLVGGPSANTIDATSFSLGSTTLDGGAGNDTLRGGAVASTLIGGAGSDTFIGGSGIDTVAESGDVDFTLTSSQLVGLGTDTLIAIDQASLTGGAGANLLRATGFGPGSVTLSGAAGNDTIIGGSGPDSLTGGDGADSLVGDAGNDTLSGGNGDDTLDGGTGVNVASEAADSDFTLTSTTISGLGSDTIRFIQRAILSGGPGDNRITALGFAMSGVTLNGGSGNDTLTGSPASDSLDGGPGDDVYRFDGATLGNDSLGDSGGFDTLDFSATVVLPMNVGVQVSLAQTTPQIIRAAEILTIPYGTYIENLTGTSGDDALTGSPSNNVISGGAGNDTIYSGFGNDALFDGTGNDSLVGGPGDDRSYGVDGEDTLLDGDGNDTLYNGLGDFNADGRSDMVARDIATVQWVVNLSTGDGSVEQVGGHYDLYVNWNDVIVGDFNGDAHDDLAGYDAIGLVQVALSNGTTFDPAVAWTAWDPTTTWSDARVGDVNDDGLDDLVGHSATTGNLLVALSYGYGFSNEVWGNWSPASHTIADLRVADIDGDGRSDIAARDVWGAGAGQPGRWLVGLSTGAGFVTQDWGPAIVLGDVHTADVNGNGRTDLVGRNENGWVVASSQGNSFTNQVWPQYDAAPVTFGVSVPEPAENLAQALEAYQWVRNNVEFQPYPGLMKGTQATAQTRAGNDWDQAALLVERLKQTGINSQLVSGRIKFQGAEQFQLVQDWLGVTRLEAALNVLSEAGLNVTGNLYQNQQVVPFTWDAYAPFAIDTGALDPNNALIDFSFDHAWVRADLPNLLGSQNLDPSWKFKDYQAGLADVAAQVPFDKAGFLAQPRSEIAYEFYEGQVIDYLASNLPGVSLGEIPHDGPIIADMNRGTPAAPPYAIDLASTTSYSDLSLIPSTRKHRVTVALRIAGGAELLQKTLDVPTVSLDRITISYVPEAGHLKPELRIDGQLAASSALTVDSGMPVVVTISHLSPGDDIVDQSFSYLRHAGQYIAVGLNAQQYSDVNLNQDRRDLNAAILSLTGEPADAGEAIMGSTLALTMAKYFHDVDSQSDNISGLTHSRSVYRRVGSGLATSDAGASYHWELQVPVTPLGMGVDIPNNVYEPIPLHESTITFDSPAQRQRLDLVGYNFSASEHAVLEEIINTESVSTVKGIQLAHAAGVPVLSFSPGAIQDIAQPLNLTASIEQSITNAVNAGFTIIVPQQPVEIHDWIGAIFIQEKVMPDVLSLGYIIEGDVITQGGSTTTPVPESEPPVPKGAISQQFSAGDPVNPSNGNMFRDETDVTFPGIGLPLTLARHYDSQSTLDIGLGVGWTHNYADSLSFGNNGDVTWTQSDGTRHTIQAVASGAYVVPATLHGTFTLSNSVYTFRNKDGLKHEFDSAGRLIDIVDRNGNKLVINRSGDGRIDSVSEFHDPTRRLTFQYSGDHISGVQDFTGRTWSYSYVQMTNPQTLAVEEYLVLATSPSDAQTAAAIVRYDYYAGGRLHGLMRQITEPDGAAHQYSYYPNRRAFEVTDALGHTTSLSYNLFRNRTSFTDERGNLTSYDYDDNGRLVAQVNPDRTRDTYTWQDDQMLSWTDASGRAETYEYFPDGLANLKRTVDRSDRVTALTYEPTFSNVVTITVNPGPEQQLTQFTYDTNGNLTQVTDPLGNRTTKSYSGCSNGNRGLVCVETAPKGNVANPNGNYSTNFAYNGAGQMTSAVTGLPTQVLHNYDTRGNLVATIDSTLVQTTYTYDLLGRRITSTLPDPDGAGPLGPITSSAQVDALGRTVAIVDANGNETDYVRDRKGQIIQTIYPDGASSQNEWDEAGSRIKTSDEIGRTTQWSYDARNRPTQAFYPDGSSSRSRFDALGNVLAATDVLGNTSHFVYDSAGHVVQAIDALGQNSLRTYDSLGNLKSETDRRGAVTTTTYDLRNRVSQVRGPDGQIRTIDYDPNGNVTRETLYDFNGLGEIPDDPRTAPAAAVRTEQVGYDVIDRVIQRVDPLNNSTVFTYDTAGRLKTTQDALGHARSINYDGAGRVRTEILPDPDGPGPLSAPVTTYTLDAVGNVLATTDPLIHTTSSVYDSRNRIVRSFDAAGFVHMFGFDAAGQLASETDELGQNTEYSYDSLGHRIRVTQPDPDFADGMQRGPITSWVYDSAGHVLSQSDPLGRVTSMQYDALGRESSRVLPDPDGPGGLPAPLVRSRYGAEGGLVQSIDQLGRSTFTIFDSSGRAVQVIEPDPDGAGPLPSPVHSSAYDAVGNRIRTSDTLGRETQFQYDAAGHLTRTIHPDPDGSGPLQAPTTATSYDAVGNVVAVTDPLGHTATFLYDNLNRRVRETQSDPDGAGPLVAPFHVYTYDGVGDQLTSADATGATTRFEYDSLNRLKRIIDPRSAATSYAYDQVGNRIGVTDPDMNSTLFDFDRLNRTVRETNSLGGSRSVVLDAVGNTLSETDRNGRVRQFTYDGLNRITSEQWMNGGSVARAIATNYDAAGRTQSVSDPDSSIAYNYDALDRPISISITGNAGGPSVTWGYTYDAAGNLATRNETVDGQNGATNNYGFDSLDRMILAQQSGSGIASKRVDLVYNALDQLASVVRSADLAGTQTVAQSTYGYDLANRLTNLSHTAGATTLAAYTYQLDAANRITRITSTADSNSIGVYSYDAASQLTSATHTEQAAENFTYDSNGNRTTSGYQVGTNNRMTSDGTFTYMYDNEGNRTRRTRIGTGEMTDYTWDHRNRLTRVTNKNPSGIVLQQVDYAYDALDRRVSRTVDPDGSGQAVPTRDYFLFEGDDVALMFRDPDASGAQPYVLISRLLYGPAVDQVLAEDSVTQGVLWALPDHEGTVHDVVARVDTTTQVKNHLVYDSFGRVVSETAPAVDHLASFTGRERDEATGLMNYRARWYDPAVGRFLSEDPAGFGAGDANLSRYVANNPVNATDPSGLMISSPLDAALSRVASPAIPSLTWDAAARDRAAEIQGPDLLRRSQESSIDPSERELLQTYIRNHLETPDESTGWPGPSPSQRDRLAAARNPGFFAWVGQLTGFAETENAVLSELQMDKNQWLAQRELNWEQQRSSNRNPLIQYFDLNERAADAWQAEMRQQLVRPFDAALTVATLAGSLELRAAGTAASEASLAARTTESEIRAMKLPTLDANLAGTRYLGYTTKDGRVVLAPGLSQAQQVETLRHESVHVFFTPTSGPLVGLRQSVAQMGYNQSAFLQGTEEMFAESYGARSLGQGMLHAFNGRYTVRGGTIITPGLYIGEAAGFTVTTGAAVYGANKLGKRIWQQRP